jgi:predicted amidohydrolase
VKAGFVQFSPEFGKIDANINKAISFIEKADADLMVLPELFNTGYLFVSADEALNLAEEIPTGKTTQALCAIARRKNMHIVAGIAEAAGNKVYNSAILIAPSGYVATYRKIHLFNEEKLWFQPGHEEFAVHDIGSCKIGMMICFDWFFPETTRILALQGADIICHPANLVLPYCQDAIITHCLGNRVFAITANRTGEEERGTKKWRYTGKSQIISADARVLYQAAAESNEVGVVEIDLSLSRNKQLNKYNNLFADRRVEFYQDLINKNESI